MIVKLACRITGLVLLIITLILILFSNKLANWSYDFIVSNIAYKKHLEYGYIGLKYYFKVAGLFILLISLFFLLVKSPLFKRINSFLVNTDSSDLLHPDGTEHARKSYQAYIMLSFLFGFLFFILDVLKFIPFISVLHGEDKFLEMFATLSALASIVLLILVAAGSKEQLNKLSHVVLFRTLLGIAIMLLLFFFLEEVNYGQLFFKWDTSAKFEANLYHETNFHNFLGFIALDRIYTYSGIVISVCVLIGWILMFFNLFPFNSSYSKVIKMIFPHPSLFFLIFFILVSAVLYDKDELFEQNFSIFILLVSINMFEVVWQKK